MIHRRHHASLYILFVENNLMEYFIKILSNTSSETNDEWKTNEWQIPPPPPALAPPPHPTHNIYLDVRPCSKSGGITSSGSIEIKKEKRTSITLTFKQCWEITLAIYQLNRPFERKSFSVNTSRRWFISCYPTQRNTDMCACQKAIKPLKWQRN